MSSVRVLSLLFLLPALAPVYLPARADALSMPVARTQAQEVDLERETFALVNAYRQDHDLPALVWDDAIAATARGHSRDMAEGRVDFGHDGFRGRVDDLRKVLAGVRGAGENVLFTDDPREIARSAVALWLRSPPHLRNIRGDFSHSGIGVWQSRDGAVYFTQIFVKVSLPAVTAE